MCRPASVCQSHDTYRVWIRVIFLYIADARAPRHSADPQNRTCVWGCQWFRNIIKFGWWNKYINFVRPQCVDTLSSSQVNGHSNVRLRVVTEHSQPPTSARYTSGLTLVRDPMCAMPAVVWSLLHQPPTTKTTYEYTQVRKLSAGKGGGIFSQLYFVKGLISKWICAYFDSKLDCSFFFQGQLMKSSLWFR